MAEKHKWKVIVEVDGVKKRFKNPDGSVKTWFESEGSISEILMKAKKYMLNARAKQN
jgi:hypothetical protein